MTKEIEMKQPDEFSYNGEVFYRVNYVMAAAMRFSTSVEGSDEGVCFYFIHDLRAQWAFDAAEALWAEACKRFPTAGDSEDEP